MAIQKRPYELSVWVEKLNGSNSKIEEKGVIIGAHDMSYPGKATNIVLKREIKGTNTLTFQLPDRYFDSLKGEYVRNEFADLIAPETKLKLFYKDRWFEFFVKKVDDKKQFKSYMKSFTCTDAFIDELSRNGYGITYDTDLYNNVEEIGTFTEETLEDSIWQYHPENNWGDFTEYKEEKLYRIPVSCFGGSINGYKLNFELEQKQRDEIKEKTGTDFVENVFTGDTRPVELSDDLARGFFWDEYVEDGTTRNALTKEYHTDIPNDGYIYVPYSCLGFCYGRKEEPDFTDELKYDRAATETAIAVNGKLILAPQSVDPRTIIQFYAIPDTGILELDDGGVIMNKDYTFFMTLADWNNMVNWDGNNKWWYMFEDIRLVHGEILGATDLESPTISHTFKYLANGDEEYIDGDETKHRDKFIGTDYESRGNKCVTYDGYLSDVKENSIIKGKKFSITNRTEVNISEEIDQYTTIYNAHADDFAEEYSSEDWDYKAEPHAEGDRQYRVCSKLATRQIIPQLARNLVQNGTDMDSVDGWSPMTYLLEDAIFITPSVSLRGVVKDSADENIATSALIYNPAQARIGRRIQAVLVPNADLGSLKFFYNGHSYEWNELQDYDLKNRIIAVRNDAASAEGNSIDLCAIGLSIYYKGYPDKVDENNQLVPDTTQSPIFKYLCDKGDFVYRAINDKLFTLTPMSGDKEFIYTGEIDGKVDYSYESTEWIFNGSNAFNIKRNDDNTGVSTVHKTGDITTNHGQDIVNFGIIGQDKIIEKDKIYCLGISAWALSNFKIKIGKGTLISEGQYEFANDNIISIEIGKATETSEPDFMYDLYSEEPEGLADDKQNIVISELPPQKFILFKSKQQIENPYIVVESAKRITLLKLYLFEAYTKGMDCFPTEESTYRYSGRDLFWPPRGTTTLVDKDTCILSSVYSDEEMRKMIIFEDQIMLGSTYGYQQYFIQRLKTYDGKFYDTMGKKEFIAAKEQKDDVLPLDAADYTEDDYEIQTNYINLNKCTHYIADAPIEACDCDYGHTCYYQKFGYCPFRFKTEKHNRRIRTLSINKSNRFNIIQQTSKVFEVYPQFYIEHKSNGSVIKADDGTYLKKIFYITEKGKENKVGFRYEKNLKDISRNVVSDKIVTKLYVLDVDSELSKTGLCSIKTAEDNPSKDSFLITLDYYIEKGMLDRDEVQQDLYGTIPNVEVEVDTDTIPSGFLSQLGYYNTQYDELSNKIINLQDASYTELEANLTVNYEGIITAQEQILKIKKQINKFKEAYGMDKTLEDQTTYQNYLAKLSEQQSILVQLIYSTFFTNGECDLNKDIWNHECFKDTWGDPAQAWPPEPGTEVTAIEFFDQIIDLEESKKYWLDKHDYSCGILGQFNKEYIQIQQWKRERASYLKLINQISTAFYKKYEPYLKEGTWSDSNYLTDNAYYFGALDVAADGSIPKVTYSISVIDLAPLSEEYEQIYDFDLADITYVEDIGMFGINKHTGLPNKLKVLVSAVQEGLDDPSKDTISVQNFTTSFQDLFQQVTSSVQSLTYNENIYKRSSNFTSLQNITNSSLQGALDTNDLTLLDTDENNIQVDNTGTNGSDINNHANKYKLDGQGLFFSNDGGQHWSVGVGPSGINADYIKVGTLDAGKIRIADSQYVYFAWDKDGIVAYRDPQAVNTDRRNINDAAIFNKYGLSIVNNGNIKLRAGYSYTGNNTGIGSETEVGDEVGFYLYNSESEVIFKTEASTSQDGDQAAKETAVIKLIGEMLVTNNAELSTTGATPYRKKIVSTRTENYYKVNTGDFRNNQDTIAQMSYNNGTLTITNLYSSLGEAIAFALNKFGNITTVEHIIGEETKTYNVSNFTTGATIFISPVSNQYVSATEHSFSYQEQIEPPEGEDPPAPAPIIQQIYYHIDTASGYPTISIRNYASMQANQMRIITTDNSETREPSISAEVWTVIRNTNTKENGTYHYNYIEGETLTVYNCGEDSYYTEKGLPDSTSIGEGSVALYLNNKTDLQSSDVSDDSRLFVCCASDRDSGGRATIRNIFSILKDGSLYIGGQINGQQDPTDLPDQISISDAGIYIDRNGQLIMDFNHIIGGDGKDLTEYIAQEIATNNDALRPLMESIAANATAGLAGADHTHIVPELSLKAVGDDQFRIDDADLDSGFGMDQGKIVIGFQNSSSRQDKGIPFIDFVRRVAASLRTNGVTI